MPGNIPCFARNAMLLVFSFSSSSGLIPLFFLFFPYQGALWTEKGKKMQKKAKKNFLTRKKNLNIILKSDIMCDLSRFEKCFFSVDTITEEEVLTMKSPTKKTSEEKSVSKKAAAVKKTVPSKESSPKASVKTSAKAAAKTEKAPAKAPAAKTAKAPAKAASRVKTPEKTAPVTPAAKAPAAKTAKAPVKAAVKKETPLQNKKNIPHKKRKLTKTQKKHFISLLMAERTEFMAQLKFHTDEALSSKKDAAGERAGMATHMADLGSDNFRHDLELGLLSEEGDVIEMIDEALQRLEDNEYGICLDCGCEIAEGRLEAKPYARYCTNCKSKREKLEDPRNRKR